MRRITIGTVTYPSVRAAGPSLGVCHATVLNWLAKGTTTDRRARPVHLHGARYGSRKAAALALGVDRATIDRWVRGSTPTPADQLPRLPIDSRALRRSDRTASTSVRVAMVGAIGRVRTDARWLADQFDLPERAKDRSIRWCYNARCRRRSRRGIAMRFVSALIIVALAIAAATLMLHLADMSWRDLFTLPW